MPHYFQLVPSSFFSQHLQPVLSAAWQQRSFLPAKGLAAKLLASASKNAEGGEAVEGDSFLRQIAEGSLSFDGKRWRYLAGLALLHGAVELPRIEAPVDTLCCLLAPKCYQEADTPRERFAPIQQVFFGSRDLVFGGGYYRPDHAGWNDDADVARLAHYLGGINPQQWSLEPLGDLRDITDDEGRADELAFVRQEFPALVALYQRAATQQWVVVCEQL